MENIDEKERIYKIEYHKISENASRGLEIIIVSISLIIIFLTLGADKSQEFMLSDLCLFVLPASILFLSLSKVILPNGYRILAKNRTMFKIEGYYELSGERIEKVTLPAKIALFLEKIGLKFD